MGLCRPVASTATPSDRYALGASEGGRTGIAAGSGRDRQDRQWVGHPALWTGKNHIVSGAEQLALADAQRAGQYTFLTWPFVGQHDSLGRSEYTTEIIHTV